MGVMSENTLMNTAGPSCAVRAGEEDGVDGDVMEGGESGDDVTAANAGASTSNNVSKAVKYTVERYFASTIGNDRFFVGTSEVLW